MEQYREGTNTWPRIAVRIEKILCTVLHELHERQVEEVMHIQSEGPGGSV